MACLCGRQRALWRNPRRHSGHQRGRRLHSDLWDSGRGRLVSRLSRRALTVKAVRTDRELECPRVDAGLRAAGVELVVLPDNVPQATLIEAARDADLILMCYQPIPAAVIDAAAKLKGIVKFGVGIDAIDIEAAKRRRVPV